MRGASRPKQFLELGGRPIIAYTLEKFATHPLVDTVTVVCLESWISWLDTYLKREFWREKVRIIPGGTTGQDSIISGVKAAREMHPSDKEAIVLIHDGVRPLIDRESITACIESVKARGCTATTAPCIETIIVEDTGGHVTNIEDRSRCRLARAPQGFLTEQIYAMHLKAQEDGLEFIDSISLMSHYGYQIYTVEGPVENIKVTTPSDYYAFKSFVEMRDQRKLWENDEQ